MEDGFQPFTRGSFASLHRLALRSVNHWSIRQHSTPLDQLLLVRAYSALRAYSLPLRLSEARQMNAKDVVLITTVREGIRPHTLQVNPDEIPNCIDAVQIDIHAGAARSRIILPEGATPTSPSGSTTASNGTGPNARSTMAAGAKANNAGENGEEEEDAKTAVALSPVDGAVRRRAVKLNLKGDDTTGAIAG